MEICGAHSCHNLCHFCLLYEIGKFSCLLLYFFLLVVDLTSDRSVVDLIDALFQSMSICESVMSTDLAPELQVCLVDNVQKTHKHLEQEPFDKSL